MYLTFSVTIVHFFYGGAINLIIMVVRLIQEGGKVTKLDLSQVKRISGLSQANIIVVKNTGETLTGNIIEF